MKGTLWIAIGTLLCFQTICEANNFQVTSNIDDGSLTPGTLRWAIDQANTTSSPPHTITFSVGNSITVLSDLTLNQDQVAILGSGNTIGAVSSAVNILVINGNTCTVQGLALVRGNNAITLGGQFNQVRACRIGTDWNDGTGLGNQFGIQVTGNNNLIGGLIASDRNVISGQTQYGVQTSSAQRLAIMNNYIGTNSSGTAALNNARGIVMNSSRQCMIGGTVAQGNLISGNTSEGVEILGCDGNTIAGNIIGLNATQSAPLGNGEGIYGFIGTGNWIGLPIANCHNVIAGNSTGIYFNGQMSSNVIQNNFIGLSSSGTPLGNSWTGIYLNNSASNLIGGNRAPGLWQKNVISGNVAYGVYISSDGNTVCGNYVGTDPAGSAAVANDRGIYVDRHFNLIGGTNLDPAHLFGNVIAGNTTYNLRLTNAEGNVVVGNNIGVRSDGTASLGTGEAISLNGTSGTLIGGLSPDWRNIVCGSTNGIHLTSGSTGNTVLGNWIGVLSDQGTPGTPLTTGVLVDGSPDNWIGLPTIGNLIAHVTTGIDLESAASLHNVLLANTICAFTDISTGVGIQLGAGANANKAAPSISLAGLGTISGTAAVGDHVQVFLADRGAGKNGGSLILLGSATADALNSWNISVAGLVDGQYVCALATDSSNNTSAFSQNHFYQGPPTPTPTPTFIATPTATTTPLPMATPTNALSGLDLDGRQVLAFPNPAKNQMKFAFHLDSAANVRIDVFNASGERVVSLAADLPAGRGQSLTWDLKDVAPGIYVARMMVNGTEKAMIKVAVVK